MRRKVFRYALSLFILLLFSTPLLAGTDATPQPGQAQERENSTSNARQQDEQPRALMLGFDPRPCAPPLEGTIRYDSAAQRVQLCDGQAWKNW